MNWQISIIYAKKHHLYFILYHCCFSYFTGTRCSPSATFVKILTNFPNSIKLEICRENSIDKFLKKLGLEDQNIEIGDKDFDKKFKLELKGMEKDFLNEILTPKTKKGFIYFFKRNPKLILNGGELIFCANGIPLDSEKLEDYYGFAFYLIDHIGKLLDKRATFKTFQFDQGQGG